MIGTIILVIIVSALTCSVCMESKYRKARSDSVKIILTATGFFTPVVLVNIFLDFSIGNKILIYAAIYILSAFFVVAIRKLV